MHATIHSIDPILNIIKVKVKHKSAFYVSFLSAQPTHYPLSNQCNVFDVLIMGGIYFTQILLVKLNLDTHDTLTLKILLIYQMTIETRNVCPSSTAAS